MKLQTQRARIARRILRHVERRAPRPISQLEAWFLCLLLDLQDWLEPC